jgi:hypothetical protein
MHRYFWMQMATHQRRSFGADRAITERRAFGGAGDDSNV